MKKSIIIYLFFTLLALLSARAQGPRFVENLGQWDDPSLFRCQMRGTTVWLEPDRFTFLLEHPDNELHTHHSPLTTHHYRTHAYQLRFLGAQSAKVQCRSPFADYENFFLGRDRSRWKGGVRSWGEVELGDLYPGVSLVVYEGGEGLKYDFLVAPGADPGQIRWRYAGVDWVSLKEGSIRVQTSVGEVIEARPYAYQLIKGEEHPVQASYVLKDNEVSLLLGPYDTTLTLVIDPELIFSTYTGSPVDNWGTTAAYDQQKNVYTAGLVFGANYPTSLGAYDSTYNGSTDVGIFVFDPTGTQRLWATYLGGNRADMPHSMVVNELNELVVFGTTGSANFPVTPRAYDTVFHGGTRLNYEASVIPFPDGSDIFVCRFSDDGTRLEASTFVGGSGNDGLNYKPYFATNYNVGYMGNDSLYANYGDGARGELICDDLANIYVGTTTFSADFPVTAGAFCTTHAGGQDGIVFKLDYNLQNLLWSGYIGGTQDDAVYSIDVDSAYNLLICGGTCSRDLPTTDQALRRTYCGGTTDGFVAKIDYYGRELMACTYYGTYEYDQCYFVRCGKRNDAFLFGQTKGPSVYLVRNAGFSNPSSGQFLARLTPGLDSLKWGTVFGSGRGRPDIAPTAFAADICDRVYAVGWGRDMCGLTGFISGSQPFYSDCGTMGMPVTADAYQSLTDAQDFYIFAMDEDATTQTYGSFFGELHAGTYATDGQDHVDGGTSRFDRCATLYQSVCASCDGTSGFPSTPGVWSEDNGSNRCNNALFRFNVADDFPVADFPTPASVCAGSGDPIEFPFTGRGDSVRWYYGDGTTALGRPSDQAGSHVYPHPGIYTVRAVAYMQSGCRMSDTLARQLLVMGDTSYRLDTLVTCLYTPVQIGLPPTLRTTYRWILGQVSDSTISNPFTNRPGDYAMIITSPDGCSDTVYQTVLYGQTHFRILGQDTSCSSPLTFRVESESGRLSYLWSSRSDLSDRLGTGSELTLDVDSSFTLFCQVSDFLGCTGKDSLRIHFYNILDSLVLEPTPCPGGCDGSATLLHSGFAQPPLSYLFDGDSQSDSLRSGLCPGAHTATLIDANGCRVEKSFSLPDPPEPLIMAHIDNLRCYHDHSGSISLSINGLHPPYTVLWDDGATTLQRDSLEAGTYSVTLTDSLGCQFERSYDVADAEEHFASIDVWADDTLLFLGQSTFLHADGCPTCTYLWTPAEPLDDPTLQTPVATLQDTTLFFVTLYDSAGCEYRDSVLIRCIWLDCAGSSLFIPNAFTPNGDGRNDQLCFRHEWVLEFDFRLFSRWGQEVYSSHDPSACWDGTFRGQPCPPGVYTYYCKILCEAGQEAVYKGDITLIR